MTFKNKRKQKTLKKLLSINKSTISVSKIHYKENNGKGLALRIKIYPGLHVRLKNVYWYTHHPKIFAKNFAHHFLNDNVYS